jgi:hypothetical protein
MRFAVKPIRSSAPAIKQYPHAVLQQDNWDDYGYKTTFAATLHLSASEKIDLGSIKILRRDQSGGYTAVPEEPFKKLSADFCSIGGSLGYYEELFKRGKSVYEPFLGGLRDVAFNDEIKADFEELEGYKVSLLRFSGAERTIIEAARLFARSTPSVKRRTSGFALKFKTQVALNANAFVVEFDFRRHGGLPNRINALIGYNGTGKTRLLSNLAIVASGYGYDNKEDIVERRAGRFVGNPPPFKSVIVISYSAFDTFVIPGQTKIEKDRLRDEGAIFGYVYCGLREREEGAVAVTPHHKAYRLRTPEEIENEFYAALCRVHELTRQVPLAGILKPLLQDASFARIGLTQLYTKPDREQIMNLFQGLSSGHKIVLKIIVELTSHVDQVQPSLILIDEPETHLHPPLLAALLKSIRVCLDHFDGYAIVATHSPVVLQETPSRYVHVLRRFGDESRIERPLVETFGENIGVITQDVFNLDDGSTDWHDSLRTLAQRLSLTEIEEMFQHRLGFAARSYVASTRDELNE